MTSRVTFAGEKIRTIVLDGNAATYILYKLVSSTNLELKIVLLKAVLDSLKNKKINWYLVV
jgi:hypothetical protein